MNVELNHCGISGIKNIKISTMMEGTTQHYYFTNNSRKSKPTAIISFTYTVVKILSNKNLRFFSEMGLTSIKFGIFKYFKSQITNLK